MYCVGFIYVWFDISIWFGIVYLIRYFCCRQLVVVLQEEKRHQEALLLMEQFCENNEETIEYAIECAQYKTALRLCAKYQNNHLKGILQDNLFFYFLLLQIRVDMPNSTSISPFK